MVSTTTIFLSNRKRALFLLAVVTRISNAFIVTPTIHRLAPSHSSGSRIRQVTRNGKHQNHRIGRNLPLNFFFGNQDQSTSREQSPSREDASPAVGGPISAALMQVGEVIRPAADVLDDATGGWALSYADLAPETQRTPVGKAFLASNLAYTIAGLVLSVKGDLLLGSLTEFASIASFIYHYTQLDTESKSDIVRFSLFIDYVMAFSAIFVGLGYIVMDGQVPPVEGLVSAGVAIGFFLLGLTVCAEGMAYVVVHSLWHVFSAYCAFLVGSTHITNTLS